MGDVDVELFHFEVAAAPLPPPPPPSAPLAQPAPEPPSSPVAASADVAQIVVEPAPAGGSSPSGGRRRRSLTTKIVIGVVALLVLPFVIAFFYFFFQELISPSDGSPPAATSPATDPPSTAGEAAPTVAPPPPLTGPATFAGTIEAPDGVDEHPLTLTAGQVVYVAGSGECASTVDYHLATPSGSQVGGSPYVCNDIGRVVAPESGTYELVVESFAGGAGPYSIEAAPVPADVTVPVTPGQPVSGEITTSG